MLAHSFVPISYWTYAFQYVVYLINRLPTVVLNNKTPFDLIYDKSPPYSSFQVFGCSCFPFLRPLNQHKLQFYSTECVFLGFNPNHKGYLCLNKQTSQIYVSRHVVFNEFSFPFSFLLSILLLHLCLLIISPFLFHFLPQPLHIPFLFYLLLLLLLLLLPFIDLHTHCLLLLLLLFQHLSLLVSHRTLIPLLQYVQFHLLYLLAYQNLFSITPPPTNTHSMVTRSKAEIYKPKILVAALDFPTDIALF